MSDLKEEDREKLADAIGGIRYVAGALEETREDKFQEDLLRASDQIKEVLKK